MVQKLKNTIISQINFGIGLDIKIYFKGWVRDIKFVFTK